MKLLTLFFFFITLMLQAQGTYYVNSAATGTNNGTSWENAFVSLQSAISVVEAGNEIWVAKGAYLPSNAPDRSAAFKIPNGIRLYGGFNGNETAISQRVLTAELSILDGNIGNPDASIDNVYHVVFTENCDSSTIIDGFIIRNGNANSSGTDGKGGGLLFTTTNATVETAPIVRNCEVKSNFAVRGGGMALVSETSDLPGLTIENTRFFQNKSQLEGGAMHLDGPVNPTRRIYLSSCDFTACRTITGNGGAISFENFGGNCLIKGCHFEKDSTKIGLVGGGIFMTSAELPLELRIENCQFNGCHSAGGGAVFFEDYGFQNPKDVVIEIENTTFLNNRSLNEGGAFAFTNGIGAHTKLSFSRSSFENNQASTEGSGIHIFNKPKGALQLDVKSSKFIENRGNVPGGGALTIITQGDNSNASNQVIISNSLFHRNRGAYSITSGQNCKNSTHIINCTFDDNSRYVFNKTWLPNAPLETSFNRMYIQNSVIIDTTALIRIFYNSMFNPFTMNDYYVNNCLLNKPDCNFDGGSVCGNHMLYEVDPAFLPNTFIPANCSPLVNRGNNFWPDSFNITTDLLQNARIIFDTVDIGAYEVVAPCISATSSAIESKHQFSILKNPVKTGALVTLLNSSPSQQKANLEIFNAQGKSVSSFDLTLNDQAIQFEGPTTAGIYLCRLKTVRQQIALKLLVVD